MPERPDWPTLPYEDWKATKKTLHMVAQMVGKAKLAVAPPQPQWLDLAVLLFNGRPATAPTDRGYIMRYDLDAEHFNAGFWAGDDAAPEAGFFGYVVPQPLGCAKAPVAPEFAGWVEEMGEWLMPYEAVRTCPDPRAAILDFLHCVYDAAVRLGGWDAAAYEYVRPPASPRGHETKE